MTRRTNNDEIEEINQRLLIKVGKVEFQKSINDIV